MTQRRTVYSASWVLPIAAPPLKDGAVCVDGERIILVGPRADVVAMAGEARHVHLGHAALLPGLVNAHSHLELTAMRGFLEGLDFREWLRTLTEARRDVMDADALLDSARHGLGEALRNGITTCADTAESIAPLTAMHEMGTRGIGYLEVFGPDPMQCPGAITGLRTRVTASRASDTALVRTGVSPHAPYTVSAALFRAVAAYARDESLPVAVHIAESEAETMFVREGAGPFAERLRARGIAVAPQARTPIKLLHDTNVLTVSPLLIHTIHVDDDDLAMIAAEGATIVHCPISNAKLGQGVAPLDRILNARVATGLGTDSVASNDRMDILGEARQATLFQAIAQRKPDALSAHAALDLATRGGARALGLDSRIGTLEPSKDADLVAFPLDQPDAIPLYDPVVTLIHVLGGAPRASLVVVAGKELVRDGQLVTQDAGLEARMADIGARLMQWRAQRATARLTH